jgi:diphthamide synthase subunit DPH2
MFFLLNHIRTEKTVKIIVCSKERSRYLKKWNELLMERMEDIAKIMTMEQVNFYYLENFQFN